MVGDPNQLPVTIHNEQNRKKGFEMSLFQRLTKADWPVHMLRVQYRMHQSIRQFPGWRFYDSKIRCATTRFDEPSKFDGWFTACILRIEGDVAVMFCAGLRQGTGSAVLALLSSRPAQAIRGVRCVERPRVGRYVEV